MPLPRDWFEQLDNAVNKVIKDQEQRPSKQRMLQIADDLDNHEKWGFPLGRYAKEIRAFVGAIDEPSNALDAEATRWYERYETMKAERDALISTTEKLLSIIEKTPSEPPVVAPDADVEEIFSVWRRFGLSDEWLVNQLRKPVTPNAKKVRCYNCDEVTGDKANCQICSQLTKSEGQS